jgi:hypothetical protein
MEPVGSRSLPVSGLGLRRLTIPKLDAGHVFGQRWWYLRPRTQSRHLAAHSESGFRLSRAGAIHVVSIATAL